MTVATTKIVEAVSAKCATAMPDVIWNENRSDQEPLEPEFEAAVNIRLVNIQTNPFEMSSQQQFTGTLQFDCYANATATKTIDQINQETHAGIIAALWDDGDPTLDGMVNDLEPSEADPSEQDVADAGWAPLLFRVEWFTRRGDAVMIVGRGGVLF